MSNIHDGRSLEKRLLEELTLAINSEKGRSPKKEITKKNKDGDTQKCEIETGIITEKEKFFRSIESDVNYILRMKDEAVKQKGKKLSHSVGVFVKIVDEFFGKILDIDVRERPSLYSVLKEFGHSLKNLLDIIKTNNPKLAITIIRAQNHLNSASTPLRRPSPPSSGSATPLRGATPASAKLVRGSLQSEVKDRKEENELSADRQKSRQRSGVTGKGLDAAAASAEAALNLLRRNLFPTPHPLLNSPASGPASALAGSGTGTVATRAGFLPIDLNEQRQLIGTGSARSNRLQMPIASPPPLLPMPTASPSRTSPQRPPVNPRSAAALLAVEEAAQQERERAAAELAQQQAAQRAAEEAARQQAEQRAAE
jgi:hypothetical protein